MLCIAMALSCVVERGDNVVIVAPVWPNIFHAAQVAGARFGLVRLDEDWTAGHWHLDLDKLFGACDGQTKAIFISTPNNPTGWIAPGTSRRQYWISPGNMASPSSATRFTAPSSMTAASTRHPFWRSPATSDPVFVINSFSKPWAMTGWRIGWLTHPKTLARRDANFAPAANTGTTSFNQYGALAALSAKGDEFRESLRKRCESKPRIGAGFHRPPEPGAMDETGGRFLRLPSC